MLPVCDFSVFFKNASWIPKRLCFISTKRTNSYIICSYQQQMILNNCLFIKLGSELINFSSQQPLNSHTLKYYYHEQEKELPADNPCFFPLVLVRHVTETDSLHTQVKQHKYTTHKQSRQTENNQNCETLGLFILLSAEIWITVMKNDWKC